MLAVPVYYARCVILEPTGQGFLDLNNTILPNTPISTTMVNDNNAQSLLFSLWLTALLPFVQILATWDLDGKLSSQAFALRHFSLPVVAGELLVIWIAARGSLNIGSIAGRLPKIASVLLVIWMSVAIIATLIEPDQRAISILLTLRYFMHGLFFAALLGLYMDAPEVNTERWLHILTIGAAAYVAALSTFWIFVPDPKSFQWTLRIPSATNIRQIGYFVAIFAVAPLALLFFGSDKHRWRYGLCFTALITFICWSGSRGALIGLITCGVASLIVVKPLPSRNVLLVTGGCTLAGMGISLLVPVPAPGFGILRIFSSVHQTSDISSGRLDLWLKTINHIRTEPFIGHGSGRFNWNMHNAYGIDLNHPHQFVLQYVYDWGIIGGAAALLSLLLLSFAALRRAKNRPLAGYAAIGAITTTTTIAMIDGALFYPISIMLTLALVVPLFAKDADEGSRA